MTTSAAGQHPQQIVTELEATLRGEATQERAEKEQAYLKSDLAFLGATVPTIRRAATTVHRQHPDLSRDELLGLVAELWGRRIHELRMAAVELLVLYNDRLTPADVALLERLIHESRTWALVDGLSVSVVGPLLTRYPDELNTELARWARHDDFWVRRASLLAYLPGLRSGHAEFERFAALADLMLEEREFFVRKAIGWVLREVGKRNPDDVIAWLEPRLDRASGLTVREAIRYLPDADRERMRPVRA